MAGPAPNSTAPFETQPANPLSQWFTGAGDKLRQLIASVARRTAELTAREVQLSAREAQLAAAESRMNQRELSAAKLQSELDTLRLEVEAQRSAVEQQAQSQAQQQDELIRAAQDLRELADELKRREVVLEQRGELVALSEEAIGQFQAVFNRAYDDWVMFPPASSIPSASPQELAAASQRLNSMRQRFGLAPTTSSLEQGEHA